MLNIVWLGDWSPREFAALQRENSQETSSFRWKSCLTLAELAGEIRRGEFPDLVLVAVHWSDEYPAESINELIHLSPLTRWVCCHGAWGDSDGRTRDVWASGSRVPLWRFSSRVREELRALTEGDAELLPLTASRDEVFHHDYPGLADSVPIRLTVESEDQGYAEFLKAACRSWGATLESSAPDMVLFDLDPDWEGRTAALADCRQRWPGAILIGLQGFPNEPLAERWRERGVTAVISKLARLQELAMLCQRRTVSRCA